MSRDESMDKFSLLSEACHKYPRRVLNLDGTSVPAPIIDIEKLPENGFIRKFCLPDQNKEISLKD